MPRTTDPELNFARARAYGSRDPLWWSNLAAVYATRQPPDLRRARKWCRRAAVRQDPRGLLEYGLMLIEGEGGPRRPTQGRRLLEVAAALGEIDALRVLSHAYARGAFTFKRSPGKARRTKQALRRALAQLRKSLAGQQACAPNGSRGAAPGGFARNDR